jgi:hypothetical protein
MDLGRAVETIFESIPEASRRMESSRLRCLEHVEKGLRQMKLKRWRQKVVDREEWASVNKGYEDIRGPQTREVRKFMRAHV